MCSVCLLRLLAPAALLSGLVCEETIAVISWEDEICSRQQSLLYGCHDQIRRV